MILDFRFQICAKRRDWNFSEVRISAGRSFWVISHFRINPAIVVGDPVSHGANGGKGYGWQFARGVLTDVASGLPDDGKSHRHGVLFFRAFEKRLPRTPGDVVADHAG